MEKFDEDDDLLDDLMNIVQNDEQIKKNQESNQTEINANLENKKNNEKIKNTEFEENDFDDENEYEEDEFDEEEMYIDEMLEKPIDMNEQDQVNFYTYDKIQIKNIYWRGCQDTILPEGWVQVTHACGMPLYLNRQSRVCTVSRPYYIAEQSARKHNIPISSIPCLAYKKRKETVENQIKEHNQAKLNTIIEHAANKSKCPFSEEKSTDQQDNNQPEASNDSKLNKKVVVSIQTNEEKSKENLLAPDQVHDYCKKLFEFDVIKVKKFKTWGDRKKFIRKSKQKKFPDNAKMLKIQTKTPKGINKELNINMTNKTALSILYEYTSQVFKTNPRFEIQEKETPKDPFHAICYIDDKVSGKGTGNSKKAAKNNAAEAALCVLIPEFKSQAQPSDSSKTNDDMYSFFDSYNVEHSHIYVLSQKLAAPLPYDILLTCLKYNFAINMSRNQKQFIEEEIKPIKYRNCLYRMKLAQYDVEVNCTKKKEGRHLASQKILKQMHPHIQTWGSMLRLYGSKMAESYLKNEQNDESEALKSNEKSNKKTEISAPSSSVAAATASEIIQKAKPNKELLEKLKEEMRKIRKTAQPETNQDSKQSDTLLTIPPLLLGNGEFTLSSCSYLMTSELANKNDSTDKQNDETANGKIMFSDFKNQKSETENFISKKRKVDSEEDEEDSDQDSNSDSTNTENNSDDSDSDDSNSNSDSNSD